ncbi:MAG: hypothetical protein Q4B50_05415 [Bacillota bacterium]|nr:hypothetical protein [Bacillota bacterium]
MPVRFRSANEDDDDDDNDSNGFVFVDADGNGYTSGQPVIVSSRLSSRF